MNDFSISHIQAAAQRLKGRVVRTPLVHSPMLNGLAGCSVYVKAESLQYTGAFKFRGALNKLLSMDLATRSRGVVAFSAGNHGHAVAAAASIVGCPAVIVMPTTAARIKVDNCRWWGARVVMYDPQTQDRAEVARAVAEPARMSVISPFDDAEIMAGQGTCGLEMVEQFQELAVSPDIVLINTSGGGLASGVTEAVRHALPDVQVYVVEPLGFDKMARSLASGRPENNPTVPDSILDGIAGPQAGALPLSVLRRHGVRGLSISDDEALVAMEAAFRYLKLVLEPAGAASLAAVLARKADFAGKTVALIASGGNVDNEIFARALALRAIPSTPMQVRD